MPDRATSGLFLMLFVAASLSLHFGLEPLRPLSAKLSLLEPRDSWLLSQTLQMGDVDEAVSWQALAGSPPVAARSMSVSSRSDFLRLEACATQESGLQNLGMLLASERGGTLDLNRHYDFRGLRLEQSGLCVEELFSRLRNDGDVYLQLRVEDDPQGRVLLRSLSLTELEETPLWRILRTVMLYLGLAMLALHFSRYLKMPMRHLNGFGLLGVAVIVFGCCVSVGLKAQIYALITSGAGDAVPATREALLNISSPGVGFGLFTLMHALLFFGVTLTLGLSDKRVWIDLCLLAAVTETLQIFVPGRGPGISDVAVDLEGVAAGCVLLLLLRSSKRVSLFLQKQTV